MPPEYGYLQSLAGPLLHQRLSVLKYLAQGSLAVLPLLELIPYQLDSPQLFHWDTVVLLRHLLSPERKEQLLNEVLVKTMATAEYGPQITLNRVQVKTNKQGLAGASGSGSVFAQAMKELAKQHDKRHLLLKDRVWKVKFAGESVDDAGGGFHESISEMFEELEQGRLPLLISSPNRLHRTGMDQDCLIFNPMATKPLHLEMFKFLGNLLGIAMRTAKPVKLRLASPVRHEKERQTRRGSGGGRERDREKESKRAQGTGHRVQAEAKKKGEGRGEQGREEGKKWREREPFK